MTNDLDAGPCFRPQKARPYCRSNLKLKGARLNTIHWLLMFAAGVLTYFFAVVIGGNLLAAIPIPLIGSGITWQSIWTTFTYAIPVALLVFVGALLTLRKTVSQWRWRLSAFGLGMIFLWLVSMFPDLSLWRPFWAISAPIAPWLGLLVAAQYFSKAERRSVVMQTTA